MLRFQHRLTSVSAIALSAVIAITVPGCTSDLKRTDGNTTVITTGTGTGGNGSYSLQVGSGSLRIEEGTDSSISVAISRNLGHTRRINLAVQGLSVADEQLLDWNFSDTELDSGEADPVITFSLNIDDQPIQSQNRVVRVIGTDGAGAPVSAELTLQVTPTTRPDIYLLIGQSNMVGFSEDNSKQNAAGQADASDSRVLQLNVTGNDAENFPTAAAFTNDSNIAIANPMFTRAIDPLHDGFDALIQDKAGSRIGLGLAFAKRALANTTSTIYLVPAAWPDSGFCNREINQTVYPNLYPELGWNATLPSDSDTFAGKLLHDRAIARTDLTIRETGGVLRGILWHQGEADSDDSACANAYAQNLRSMVNSLRSNIMRDARGASGRGPNAVVPFVVGTMSQGSDSRGDFLPFISTKLLVDTAHRNIGASVAHAAVVNNDDLTPAAYPCGEGSCIHFGSSAYREMGARYYDQLFRIVNR